MFGGAEAPVTSSVCCHIYFSFECSRTEIKLCHLPKQKARMLRRPRRGRERGHGRTSAGCLCLGRRRAKGLRSTASSLLVAGSSVLWHLKLAQKVHAFSYNASRATAGRSRGAGAAPLSLSLSHCFLGNCKLFSVSAQEDSGRQQRWRQRLNNWIDFLRNKCFLLQWRVKVFALNDGEEATFLFASLFASACLTACSTASCCSPSLLANQFPIMPPVKHLTTLLSLSLPYSPLSFPTSLQHIF